MKIVAIGIDEAGVGTDVVVCAINIIAVLDAAISGAAVVEVVAVIPKDTV
jgi:adenosylcobinamide amidohydrolase